MLIVDDHDNPLSILECAIQLPKPSIGHSVVNLHLCLFAIALPVDYRQTQNWVSETSIPACAVSNNQFISRMLGIFWKLARIGERKSPYVGVACVLMAASILFWS